MTSPNPFRRHGLFALLVAGLLAAFWRPLLQMARLIGEHEHYSHISLIPLVTAYLLYSNRGKIFQAARYAGGPGALLWAGAAAVLAYRARAGAAWSENDLLSVAMLALFLFLLGAFVLCYGPAAFRAAAFALFFLGLAIPIPDAALRAVIGFLQYRSADISEWMFGVSGMPTYRDGLIFHLPGISIQVAEECSGIRSSLALLITGLLAAHFFLRTWTARLVFILAIVPIAVLKNGIRIVSITAATLYVDPGFMHGPLHQQGGFVFFGIGLLTMGAVLWLLKKAEARLGGPGGAPGANPGGAEKTRRPLRVCMLSYSFYEVDNRVMRYAEALVNRGDEVEALCLGRPGQPAESVAQGVRVSRIQTRVRDEGGLLDYVVKILLFLVRADLRISFRHLRKRYDVIHVHSMPDFLVFAAWFPRLTGARVILDIHDLLPEMYLDKFSGQRSTWLAPFLFWEEKLSCRFAHYVIIANHLWAQRLAARSVRAGRWSAILNYPDRAIFARRQARARGERFVFIYPGSLNWHQGLDIAVRALAIVRRDAPGAELHIYGDGPQRAMLQDLAAELGLNGFVRVEDPVPLREIPRLLEQADAGIVPKRRDSFGNEAFSTKILEFMSFGLPVIVSDTSVDQYYFNSSVVKFFSSGDEKSLAEAMRQLIADPQGAATLTMHADRFVENFDWDKRKDEYFGVVDSLCRERS